ncbi:UMP kinase [Chlamydiifrater volucris]|uniref:UMP kinase n=1 Tax=Chlamydiifrater volucris TaxID=2681470 RepID=UPI001BCAEC21|nr:UMP kinase [Chlamydiifrater volucris]
MSSLPKRVLFKISGESLAKESGGGLDEVRLSAMVGELRRVKNLGVQTIVVIGGGNILRGLEKEKELQINRVSADQMGMLATLINGMALADALKAEGISCLLTSTLSCPQVADLYNPEKALDALTSEKIVICTTGAGTPYLTTDTAAALRACELRVDLLLKATMHVDGVYDKDPRKFDDAIRYDRISYREFLTKQLGAMDASAVTLCRDGNVPIRVFCLSRYSLENALLDDSIGSLICKEE